MLREGLYALFYIHGDYFEKTEVLNNLINVSKSVQSAHTNRRREYV